MGKKVRWRILLIVLVLVAMIGGYATALLDFYWKVPLALAIPAAIVATGLAGFVMPGALGEEDHVVPAARLAAQRATGSGPAL